MAKRLQITDPEKRLRMGEKTEAQVVAYTSGDTLMPSRERGVTYATYRTIRKDPTVALARAMLGAAVLSGAWSIEADDDADTDAIQLIKMLFLPIREQVMEAAAFGGIDYGWQGFEKVFIEKDGLLLLKKLKPLLPDLTTILVDKNTGAFAGYKQPHRVTGGEIILPVEQSLHIGFRVEGTQWHGHGLLENVRAIQAKWEQADLGAATYDKKIAGSHFVVYYPPGVSKVDGTETDNGAVAALLLNSLEGSGSITIPRTIAEFVDQLNAQAAEMYSWKVELLEDSGGRQPTFVDRLKYLDALKVRAMLFPERAILEGEFGTKAEAGEHADMAIANVQLLDRHITRHINWYAVDSVLALNYGDDARGKVYLVAAPLVDAQIIHLRQVYAAILANPQGFLEEFGMIDTDALKDKLNIPASREIAQAGEGNLEEPELADTDAVMPGLVAEERARLSHVSPELDAVRQVTGAI